MRSILISKSVEALLGEGEGHQIVLDVELLVAEMDFLVVFGIGCCWDHVFLEEIIAIALAHLGYRILHSFVLLEDDIVLFGQKLVFVLVAQQHRILYFSVPQFLADFGKVALEGINSVHKLLPFPKELYLFKLACFSFALVLLS